MIFVGCSGFPVPVSRYWHALAAVEITDTELAMPGAGTVRRWMREAPEGFAFTLLAPKEVGESGFQKKNRGQARIGPLSDLAAQLGARAVVFKAPEDFKHAKNTRAAVAAYIKALPASLPTIVLDLPGWKPAQAVAAARDARVVAAYDPLADEPPPAADLAYVRLPGPAGRRSRYDDEAIAQVADHCRGLEAETVICVFRNIDGFVNAQQLVGLLG